ncbi:lipoprotein [Streptomyces aureoverticillatus]|nr:lipoprotein [Streptomyces aureoverticillatus]
MTVRSRRPRARGMRVLVGVGATAVAVGMVAACGASAEDDSDPEQRSFALPGHTLTVDSDDSALELVVSDDAKAGDVRVTRWFDGRTVIGESPKVTWKMDGDRLTFRTKCSGVISNCSAKHRVVVPRGVAVTVLDDDGKVTATGFREPLKVRTSDGSVTVKDARGPLDLRSVDGSVRALGVTSKRVSAASRDGSVRLELATAPDRVQARSQDGSVTVALPVAKDGGGRGEGSEGGDGSGGGGAASYRVDTTTVDGRADVSVPRDSHSPHHVSVRSVDGNVTVRSAN